MKLKTLILATFLAVPCFAGSDDPQLQPIGPFGGLNTNVSQEALDATQSPDLLNVDITQGGKSVKKRQGYGLDTVLSSTEPTHNLYKFFDSSGNEVRLAFNDVLVSASVNGAAWSVILTTGTKGATWDCTDYLGYAYCVSSAFDNPIKTNGTIAGTSGVGGTNQVPAGSLISNSGDRLLVGATVANPSRFYYSQSAVFTNFALGVQPSDSSYEDIVAPGSKLTHLAYRFGRWLWWKDQSFGFIVGTGQFDLQIVVVSNTIGTFDNTDVFDGNYDYFRGSDGKIYTYDGSNLSRAISNDIGPSLGSTNRRKANQWQQTNATDFNGGAGSPIINISTSISIGDVTISSFSLIENTTNQFSSGTFTNTMINGNSITISTNNTSITNGNFSDCSCGTTLCNWSGGQNCTTSSSGGVCTINPRSSSYMLSYGGVTSSNLTVTLKDCSSSSILSTTNVSLVDNCSWASNTLSQSGQAGKPVKIGIGATFGSFGFLESVSDCFISNGSNITFYTASKATNQIIAIDDITDGKSTILSGNFKSQIYDTKFTSSTFQISTTTFSLNGSASTLGLMTSSSPVGPFNLLLSTTGTNGVGNRYIQYIATFSVSEANSGRVELNSIAVISRSTGTYYSAVNNSPNLSSWNNFSASAQQNGGTITYFTRASTNSFTVLSSTPTWVAQTNNATVSASTGTYMQARIDFSIDAATETPTLNDFTFNWYEGSASDKMYGTYFNNAIWLSMSLGTTSTNNRIFRYDLLSNLWTLYDIPANGFLTYNNNLYFGSPTSGKIFQFGQNVYSDNGSAINAYWKSKAFFGDSPFTNKDLRWASWYVGESSGTTLTLTYTMDEASTTTKSLNLFDSRKGIIQNNWNFPLGSVATNFNVQFGDNSTNPPWEVFGGGIYFVPRPWKVTIQ